MSESKIALGRGQHGQNDPPPQASSADRDLRSLSASPPKWRLPLIWLFLTLVLDLGGKALALAYISHPPLNLGLTGFFTLDLDSWKSCIENSLTITVIPGFFNLVLVGNTGAAFSIFSGDSGGTQGLKMAALAAAALLPFIYFYVKARPGDRCLLTSLGLIWGGALGNIHDRLRWGAVVDFLDFHWAGYHWPAFNVADIAICVGAGLLALSVLREKPPSKSDGAVNKP